ncbi:methionine synthase reductase [Spea bombifrons]|uniref:methionine synthase reductase n=1 Tax=Spea bombifrons TaxID=233779 RepID=UPI00234B8037|nr:methionine synthase reductase [Spea bombifrons]
MSRYRRLAIYFLPKPFITVKESTKPIEGLFTSSNSSWCSTMCGTLKRRFLLLYGTQQGQAKAIAEEIGQQADHHGLVADIHCLKDINKFSLEKERSPVVIVVSTTGTGDPPDNALKFMKKIKNKELAEDHFSHVRYGLLALGDSEYTYFCNGGKIIDQRLQELGAKHFYGTGYADDCVGLELVVDPWIEGLWTALKNELALRTENQDMDAGTGDHNNVNNINHRTSEVPEDLDLQIQAIHLEAAFSSNGSSDKDIQLEALNAAEPSLVHSVPPLSQCSLNVPALSPPFLDVLIPDCKGLDMDPSVLYPENNVFKVPISLAEKLTSADAVKATWMLELDVSNTDIEWQPGDSFCVVCPNPPSEVEELLQRLGLLAKKDFQVSIGVKSNTKKKGASLPSYIPEKCSLQFLLTWCLEIRTIPKKAFLRALVEHTTNVAEKRRLQELCSKQGSSDYNQFIRDQAISLLDLLTAFPSCRPPLSVLIEYLPKLQARPYSAASSNLFYPGKLRFVFNVVELPSCLERTVSRKGVCTGWLSELSPFNNAKREEMPAISIFSRPSMSFQLPTETSAPVVMVGPGTGIAPFIAFLQHRLMLKKINEESKFGETWLFFGCRHRDKDYLFREELNQFVESGVLTHLKVCFSRESTESSDVVAPRYVQDFLKMCSQDVARILTKENGCFYVCGDAKNMVKDVNDALADIICMELGVDKLEALKTLAVFRDRKQYLQDVWR